MYMYMYVYVYMYAQGVGEVGHVFMAFRTDYNFLSCFRRLLLYIHRDCRQKSRIQHEDNRED